LSSESSSHLFISIHSVNRDLAMPDHSIYH
jgi:hypothetical protein